MKYKATKVYLKIVHLHWLFLKILKYTFNKRNL